MKPWRHDEEGLARWLGGSRRPRRVCDVAVGRWRLDVRRRKRFTALAWVQAVEAATAGDVSAVAVHCADEGRWLVVLDLDQFRDLLRRAGDVE